MIVLAIVCGAVIAGLLYQLRTLQNMLLKQATMFTAERAELLTRIQHPDVIFPTGAPDGYQDASPPEDEFERVGHVWEPEELDG